MDRKALFLSENQSQSAQLSAMLLTVRIELTRVNSLRLLAAAIKDVSPGVVLVDAAKSGNVWRDALERVRRVNPAIQALITTSQLDVHFWTDALEAGAYDILTQPFHAFEVERLFAGAWRKHEAAKIPPSKALTTLRSISAVS